MKKTIIGLVIIAGLGLTTWGTISTINTLIIQDEGVNSSWSQVLSQYERRSDLIPNLVAVVKGAAAHEHDTLEDVIAARAKATQISLSMNDLSNAHAMQQFQQAQSELSSALARLMVVVEKYPDLKVNENFLSLQSQLEGTENRIAVARMDYINAVRDFNIKIRKIPNVWIANLFTNLKPKASFTIEPQKQEVPKVEF